ncbi:hypothetical protein C1H46_017998 [Malus baccata]|uniref:Uncharacterized protein n=1 Tax=Malus baccata TaxID=106549 RepID=A0A540MCD0_MALBA|nr:hypothetical protein C1H46_017998 [Malus baccata]
MTSGRTVLPLRFISISLAAPRVLIVQLFVGFSSSYSVIHVLLIVEGKKHGKAGSSICFHRFLELSLKLRIAGLRKKEIANSKAWCPAFSLEISAMAAPPNLRPLFRTRYQIRFCLYGNMDCSGYVGEDGGEKYNWERYAERFTKHL